MSEEKFLLTGAVAIAAAIGEHKDSISRLVRQEALPAWKRDGKGPWRAHPDDLRSWVREQADKFREVG